jgi:transcriptional regulator with XRE-family HTH domain
MPAGGRPTVRSRRLGRALRQARLSANLDQEEAAAALRCSAAKISRLESGHVSARPLEVVILLGLYGVTDPSECSRLETLAKESPKRGWWLDYADMLQHGYADQISFEADATHIFTWQSVLIPGLLQTEQYARETIASGLTHMDGDQVAEEVKIRMQRQARISEEGVYFTAILWEPAVREPIWSRSIQRKQLERLASVAQQRNVTIQILPYASLVKLAQCAPFSAYGFGAEPNIEAVTVGNLNSTSVFEDEQDLSAYSLAFAQLRSAAKSPDDSLELIKQNIGKLGNNHGS